MNFSSVWHLLGFLFCISLFVGAGVAAYEAMEKHYKASAVAAAVMVVAGTIGQLFAVLL